MACACKGKKNSVKPMKTLTKRPSQLSHGRVRNRVIKREIH